MSETSTTKTSESQALRERARLSFDLDVDIAVVGAGLAGLTVALEAARLGASVDVLAGRHVRWYAVWPRGQRRRSRWPPCRLERVRPSARHGDAGLWSADRRSERARRFRRQPRTLGAVEGGRRICPGDRDRTI